MTVESEYEAEALSMLTQYGQTLTMNGNGLAKCPYVFREQYDIGDTVTVAFSGKSAKAQILSITEHWTWGSYDISFAFGKPQNNLSDQLQLMLRKIQEASNKTNSTDSVRWYTIPTDTAMPKADVTYNTIGFVGTVGTGATFTLYLDNEKTGAKTYHIYFKQLGGTGKLTLTTGKAGATNLTLNAGTYVAIIYVDENGNITNTASTPTAMIEAGSTQPATSGGVSSAIGNAITGQSGTSAEINIGEVAWIKVCSIEDWSKGDVLELYFQNNWNTQGSSARKITIAKGTAGGGANLASWVNVTEEASDPQTLLSEIQICGANSTSSADKVFVYVKYSKATSNTIRMAYKSVGFNPPTIYMTKETPSGYALNVNYALHDKGVYVNGEGLASETNLAYTNQYSSYCAENANLQVHKVKNGVLYINMTFLFASALTFTSGSVFLTMDKVLTSNAIINIAINGIPYFGYIRAVSYVQAGKSDIVLRPAETSIVISAGKEVNINCAIPVQ